MLSPKRRMRSYRATALKSVMSKRCATCTILRERTELEGWKQLHVGGTDGTACRHFQATTQLLQKHWGWEEDWRKNGWHGSEQQTTMYMASMDTKTAFDVARPRHIATILGKQGTHGWILVAVLREVGSLKGQTTFLKDVEFNVNCTRCIRQGSVEAPTLGLILATCIPRNVEWLEKHKLYIHTDRMQGGSRRKCSFLWVDNCWVLSYWNEQLEREKGQHKHPFEKTSTSWDATSVFRVNHVRERVWNIRYKTPTTLGGETRRPARAKTYRMKCRRMVEQVYSVFRCECESWSWSRNTVDKIKGWETQMMRKRFKFRRKAEETRVEHCTRTAR